MVIAHTPGPWAVNDEGEVCLPNGSDMIAWVSSPDDIDVHGESPESLANAHLIAAAPELLAASISGLEAIDNILSAHTGQTEYAQLRSAFDALESAIAHAEGRAPLHCYTCGKPLGDVRFKCPICDELQCSEACLDKHVADMDAV